MIKITTTKAPLIVIDGANIGHWSSIAGEANTKHFRSDRLLQAVTACQDAGLDPIVLLPQKFLTSQYKHNVAKDVDSLLALETQGLLSRLPSYINDDNPILELALKSSGYVLSNDGFNDHLKSGKIDQLFRQTRVFKCFEFKHQLQLIPPERYAGKKTQYQPPPTTTPPPTPSTKIKNRKKKPHGGVAGGVGTLRRERPHLRKKQHPSPQPQPLQKTNPNPHQKQLLDLQERLEELEYVNASLYQQIDIHNVFDQLREAESAEEFESAFDLLESYQDQLSTVHYNRLIAIVKFIHVPSPPSRKEGWQQVKQRFGIFMVAHKQKKEEQERLIRQRIEREREQEAEEQRKNALLLQLQRDTAKAKQIQEQRKRELELKALHHLRQQQQQHFNLPFTAAPLPPQLSLYQRQQQQQQQQQAIKIKIQQITNIHNH